MRTRSRHRLALMSAAGALSLGLVSCDKSPTSPSPGPSPPPSAFVRLELVAPQEIAPGESVQLTARAVKSDGSVENVTGRVEWTVQSVPTSSVLTLTGMGLATGGERGQGLVTVRFASLTADATILVLPKGTFRLAGRIMAGGAGLENVRVTVISGVGEGLTARTNVSGEYELYGIAGSVQIRASKDGYIDWAERVDVTAHGSHTFEMTANDPKENYAGVYALTITAGICTSGFPDAAKQRVYTAWVEQTATDLRVFLTGADFRSGTFGGEITRTDEIKFIMRPASVWDYDPYEVEERLSDGSFLRVSGNISARSTPSGLSGTGDQGGSGLDGVMYHDPTASRCDIDRFEMVRR